MRGPMLALVAIAALLLISRRLMPETLFRIVVRLCLTPGAFNSVGRVLYKVD